MVKKGRVFVNNQVRCFETRPILPKSLSVPIGAGKRMKFGGPGKAKPEQSQE